MIMWLLRQDKKTTILFYVKTDKGSQDTRERLVSLKDMYIKYTHQTSEIASNLNWLADLNKGHADIYTVGRHILPWYFGCSVSSQMQTTKCKAVEKQIWIVVHHSFAVS